MRMIIDTDPAMGTVGGDPEDSFAIMLGLVSPEVSLEGITVVQGNVPVDHGFANATHLLNLMGRSDVPLLAGCTEPLNAPGRSDQLAWLAGRASLDSLVPEIEPAGDAQHAVEFIVDTVLANPGEITIVGIGPLTNLGEAIRREPSVAELVDRFVLMAGNAAVAGNITPFAEFNVWQDPEAAAIVFESGARITVAGLDVCEQTHLSAKTIDSMRGATELGTFVADSVAVFMQIRSDIFGADNLHLYDSLSVAAAIDASIIETEDTLVRVDTESDLCAGATVAYLSPFQKIMWTQDETNCAWGTVVDLEAFDALFGTRVLRELLGATL